MKVLLITLEPERAASEPESPAAALRDLGCDVRAFGFDLGFDEDDLAKDPPQVLVLDARERLEMAYSTLKTLRDLPPLARDAGRWSPSRSSACRRSIFAPATTSF